MGGVSKEQILNHMTNLFEYASSRALGAGRLPMSLYGLSAGASMATGAMGVLKVNIHANATELSNSFAPHRRYLSRTQLTASDTAVLLPPIIKLIAVGLQLQACFTLVCRFLPSLSRPRDELAASSRGPEKNRSTN
jgi:hypothetical protein